MNLRIRFALASVAVVVIVAAAHSENVGMSPAIAAQESISRAMALTFVDLRYAHVSLDGFWCKQPTGTGDNEIWRIGRLNGILYLPDVGSKTTSFSFACAGIFASN